MVIQLTVALQRNGEGSSLYSKVLKGLSNEDTASLFCSSDSVCTSMVRRDVKPRSVVGALDMGKYDMQVYLQKQCKLQ